LGAVPGLGWQLEPLLQRQQPIWFFWWAVSC